MLFPEYRQIVEREVVWSSALGALTSIYFWPEILMKAATRVVLVAAAIQMVHDTICWFFVILVFTSVRERSVPKILVLNIVHCIIMALFAYYKRCILTLLYNHLLGLDMFTRYIPIWQRVLSNLTPPCSATPAISHTYLWLNDHILKSLIVGGTNMMGLYEWGLTKK